MDKSDFIVWASQLQASYEPSEETKKRLANIHLVAIVGPTGVGKSTIIDKLGLHHVLSDVSRKMRPGEKEGQNYFYKHDYLAVIKSIKQGEYAQFLISPTGEFYGTKVDSYPESGFCTMAIMAEAIPKFRELGFKKISQFYIMPPSYVEWMRRIGGVRTEDLLGRIAEARGSIKIALEDEDYVFILNDVLENAVQDVQNVLNGEEVNSHRQDLARGTADILLERISSGEEEF